MKSIFTVDKKWYLYVNIKRSPPWGDKDEQHEPQSKADLPHTSLLRKRMVQGGLLRAGSVTQQLLNSTYIANDPRFTWKQKREKEPRKEVYSKKKITIVQPSAQNSGEKEDLMDTKNLWLPKKRHFRETEEWRIKKTRVLNKMRALTRINLLLVLSKMSVRGLLHHSELW
ncbi:hypothetical protein Y032_0578g234 [Ancylostoma ceylanicum]|uniref:Uncharacterized protein n=1 Tax=Ancylostoma ceylanicum TaxID=53326 RepID=A0A016WQA2_9BILA|nr:hypothetical protein Y032_0578g234 [Ancylostoma ceylanicum]